jgi:cytochrome c-type biogenesis protein CcmF
MQLAHLGIAVCALGVVLSSKNSAERDLRMAPGERGAGRLPLPVRRRQALRGPNFISDKGTIGFPRWP